MVKTKSKSQLAFGNRLISADYLFRLCRKLLSQVEERGGETPSGFREKKDNLLQITPITKRLAPAHSDGNLQKFAAAHNLDQHSFVGHCGLNAKIELIGGPYRSPTELDHDITAL
jgi:hypothetical protein